MTSFQLAERNDHNLGGERAVHKVLLLVLPVLPQVLLQVLPQVLQPEKSAEKMQKFCFLLVTISGGQA